MSFAIPDGAKLFIGTVSTTIINATLSTGSPAVATIASGHGLVNGDEVLLNSLWEESDATLFRLINQLSTSVGLEGLDSTDTSYFAPSSNTGSLQKITGWTEVAQVTDIAMNGGDPKFATVGLLSRRRDINLPAGFNPMSITITLADDPALTGQIALKVAGRSTAKRPFKMLMPGSGPAYWFGNVSFNDAPQIRKGQANTVQATVSLLGQFNRYAS
ncbi:phage tail tube protein [Azohydromonas aeria]|uniref:phage tail tube protein n=1 Tax=Azohydromonas aeria TaxID=2590212 RepID=UPI0012FBEE4F|nr:phage tail tube protein [Azohydromonas aeria]